MEKKIELDRLNEVIKDYAGREVVFGNTKTTYKALLLQYVNTVVPKDGIESAAVWSLATRLHETEKDSIEINKAELTIIHGSMEPPKLVFALHEPFRVYIEGKMDETKE